MVKYFEKGYVVVEADDNKVVSNGVIAAPKVYFIDEHEADRWADWTEVEIIAKPEDNGKVYEGFIEDILASIPVLNKPANKEGYVLEQKYDQDAHAIVWEYIEDPVYKPSKAGTFIDPIDYVDGMTVNVGLWYTDGTDIWECIAEGIPSGFDDTGYFDIIPY